MSPAVATPRVLVLDDDPDLLDVFETYLRSFCGLEPILLRSYDELVRRGEEALGCELAILDINLGAGEPSGVDALRWLEDHRFRGRVTFLTGHARSHPGVAQATRAGEASLLSKPISPEELVVLVQGARESGERATR